MSGPVVNKDIVSVILMYVPLCGRSNKAKSAFYDQWNVVVSAKEGDCMVMGDIKGYT